MYHTIIIYIGKGEYPPLKCLHMCMWICVDSYVENAHTYIMKSTAFSYAMHNIEFRSWRNNIRSKVTQPNQLEIYQTICIMESELDEEAFKNMLDSFIQHWEKIEPGFIKYFQDNYYNRCGKKFTIIIIHIHNVL